MCIFKSENDLLATLDRHDKLVRDCISNQISFSDFMKQYDNFYMSYALDGHESTPAELQILLTHENRIAPHREIWEKVVAGGLTADENALKTEYIEAGRFGSVEAEKRLAAIADGYFCDGDRWPCGLPERRGDCRSWS